MNPPPHAVLRWAQRRPAAPVEAQRRGRAARFPRRRRQGTARPAEGDSGRIRRRLVRDLRAVAEEPGDHARTTPRPCPAPRRARRCRRRSIWPPRKPPSPSMASILFRIEREAERAGPRLPHRRGYPRTAWRPARWPRSCISRARKPSTRSFETLDVLHQAGLRSLGPVWSRPNAFGHGVPFRFPSSPDTGPGPDRSRQGAGPRLQPAENPDRPVASQRTRLLGRRRVERRAAGRHAFQRPRA